MYLWGPGRVIHHCPPLTVAFSGHSERQRIVVVILQFFRIAPVCHGSTRPGRARRSGSHLSFTRPGRWILPPVGWLAPCPTGCRGSAEPRPGERPAVWRVEALVAGELVELSAVAGVEALVEALVAGVLVELSAVAGVEALVEALVAGVLHLSDRSPSRRKERPQSRQVPDQE